MTLAGSDLPARPVSADEVVVLAPDQQARAGPGRVLLVGVASVLLAAVVLRFWARSDMWLDEAQTVAIAKLPLTRIPGALRQDGSPPLYYFLLHLWMKLFGGSDLAVRSMSGLFGVAALPLMWLSARRTGERVAGFPASRAHGHAVALAAALLLAGSPFAVRYSTEARMYTMVVVLVLCGHLALTSALARPTVGRLTAVALVSGLLMLSHYWCLYLIGAVLLLLGWRWLRPGTVSRPAATRAVGAVVAGSVLFAPWFPSFHYQMAHTGTPWARAAYLGNLGTTISDFFGMGTNPGRLLGYLAFGLALFGLFGRAVDRTHVDFDLRGRPAARPWAFLFGFTMLAVLSTAQVFGDAYAPRYTAVVLVPFLMLVAMGVGTLADRRVRGGVLAVAVLGGLAVAVPNVTAQRTQAGEVAAALEAWGHRGDLVVYCPDQLAPAVNRLLPAGYFVQVPYPDGPAARVDWVDYAARYRRSDPAGFARGVAGRAGITHNTWLVWSPDYPPTTGRCTQLLRDLEAVRPLASQMIGQNLHYYEHAYLEGFPAPDGLYTLRRVPRQGSLP